MGGRPPSRQHRAEPQGTAGATWASWSRRGRGDGMSATGEQATREPPSGAVTQPDAREGQAGPLGETDRSVVPGKPGNAGGGKGPGFKANGRSNQSQEIDDESNTSADGSEVAG